VAIFKTHIDIVTDFNSDTVTALRNLSEKHNFLIFEDRKFVDIGNTAKMQYTGALRIVEFANFVNASVLGGEGVIHGLQEAAEDLGLKDERALLLLAEMSTRGSLAVGSYTQECVDLALKNQEFVAGFVSLGKLPLPETQRVDFVTFTTGISSSARTDPLGQQYQTPAEAIVRGSDIVIVGRGIYGSDDPEQKVKEYQIDAWNAYEKTLADA
jgi:orotidine-5'-phosphate decarboxylase